MGPIVIFGIVLVLILATIPGNGFPININHSTCIGKVVGIGIGGINQLF